MPDVDLLYRLVLNAWVCAHVAVVFFWAWLYHVISFMRDGVMSCQYAGPLAMSPCWSPWLVTSTSTQTATTPLTQALSLCKHWWGCVGLPHVRKPGSQGLNGRGRGGGALGSIIQACVGIIFLWQCWSREKRLPAVLWLHCLLVSCGAIRPPVGAEPWGHGRGARPPLLYTNWLCCIAGTQHNT